MEDKYAERSNCLIFALHKWVTEGGYIIVRRSRRIRRIPFWHFLWVKDLKDLDVISYVPHRPSHLNPLFFKGYIKVGDKE